MGKKKKGKDDEAPAGPGPAATSGSALRAGVVVTVVVLVPQAWPAVADGSLELTTALYRGVLVALACGAGAMVVLRVVDGYRAEVEQDRRIAATLRALREMFPDADGQAGDGPDGAPESPAK